MSELDVASELRNLHAAAEQTATELQAMANVAKEEARRYERALEVLEGRASRPGPKPGSRNGKYQRIPNERRLTETHEWLKAHADQFPDGFYAGEVARKADFGSDATIAKTFAALHERGLIRLDRMGHKGAKVYKLV